MELAGLIKLQKGCFSLTKKGQNLTYLNKRGELFLEVIKAHTRKYNWGYQDGYEGIHIVQESFLYTLYMLSIFGKDWRPIKFIEDRFLEAFPTALDDVEGNAYFSQEETLRKCYRLRSLDRFAHFWGLIKMREIKTEDAFSNNYEFKASELSDWLTFHA